MFQSRCKGLAIDIGDLRDTSTIVPGDVMSGKLDPSAVDRIFAAENALSDNYELRVDMGQKMQSMIDGRGADRLGEKLTTLFAGK